MRLRLSPTSTPVALSATRRQAAALVLSLPMMLRQQPASALLGFGSDRPRVEQVGSPEVCQARANEQDFVVIKYTGRFADGTVFDDRYAEQPLTYELGSFYLPVRLHTRPCRSSPAAPPPQSRVNVCERER